MYFDNIICYECGLVNDISAILSSDLIVHFLSRKLSSKSTKAFDWRRKTFFISFLMKKHAKARKS